MRTRRLPPLFITQPHLAAEWHPTRNTIHLDGVSAASHLTMQQTRGLRAELEVQDQSVLTPKAALPTA